MSYPDREYPYADRATRRVDRWDVLEYLHKLRKDDEPAKSQTIELPKGTKRVTVEL